MTARSPLAQPGPPRRGNPPLRGALHSLVQGALVDLFAAYNVGVAPLPYTTSLSWAVPEVSVAVRFTRRDEPHGGGEATLSISQALLAQMKGTEATAVQMDWARELTNQFMGRVKNRLLAFGVQLDIGALSHINRQLMQQRLPGAAGTRVYAARTLRGLVLATLHGLPEEASLSYVGTSAKSEGSMLWL